MSDLLKEAGKRDLAAGEGERYHQHGGSIADELEHLMSLELREHSIWVFLKLVHVEAFRVGYLSLFLLSPLLVDLVFI